MQAFHFEAFAVNYTTLVGLLITVTLLWKPVPRRFLIWMTALSLSWGVVAVGLPSRVVFVPLAIANDQRIPVLLRLKKFSGQDGTLAGLRTESQAPTLVFSPSVALIALLPTWTSQGTLLDMTGVDCAGVTPEDRKKFFYLHLYYCHVEAEALRKALSGPPDPLREELASVRSVVFGHARLFPGLSSQFKPVNPEEIDQEVFAYQAYANSFSREEVLSRPIKYAVIPAEGYFDFTNLDRWYERNAGERVGAYTIYHLKLRN